MVFSGGGYFRLFPYTVIHKLMLSSEYVMAYFHPRDFDPDQPLLPGLNIKRRFKSYYGLSRSEKKLDQLLNDFSFFDIRRAKNEINWSNILDISNI